MAKLSSRFGLKDAGGRGLPAKNSQGDTLSARMGIGHKK